MKSKIHYIFVILLLLALPVKCYPYENDTIRSRWQNITDYTKGILRSASAGVEYRVKAGIAIGGVAPIPIPIEMREVHGFNPLINTSLEAEFLKTLSEDGGLSFGLRLETKGMETDALVNKYSMVMSEGNQEIKGFWYGKVKMKTSLTYLTLPVLAVWKPSERWDIKIGPYVSYMLYGSFSGSAYDGYLRENEPTGEKTEFIDGKTADFNFSSDLRRWHLGAQIGADWRAFPHLLVGLDLTWGFTPAFKKDFEVIKFNMFPIYVRLNFGYAF